MFRKRLRPEYTDEQLKSIYPEPHTHSKWKDHHARVTTTVGVARFKAPYASAADLSCGDGWIIDNIDVDGTKYRGDYAPGYTIQGPLEETIEQIPNVDLYICSETIEHLNDPDTALSLIRPKTNYILLSTPIGEDYDGNIEHYWGWDEEAVHEMLYYAGFHTVHSHATLRLDPGYDFQIWLMS